MIRLKKVNLLDSLIFLFLFFRSNSITEHFELIENFESGRATLYENTTHIPTNSNLTFNVQYDQTFFELPNVLIGIIGLKGNDRTLHQIMKLKVSNKTLTYFEVYFQQQGSTEIAIIKINYLIFPDVNYLELYQHQIQTFEIVNYNTSNVSETLVFQYSEVSFEELQSIDSFIVINGFNLQSIDNLQIKLTLEITNHTSYQVSIFTLEGIKIHFLCFMVLIIKQQKFPRIQFERYYHQTSIIQHTTLDQDYLQIQGYNQAIFFIGFSGVQNNSPIKIIFQIEDNITANFINIFSRDYTTLNFSYILLGKVICDSYISTNNICIDLCQQGQTQSPRNRKCQKCVEYCQECEFRKNNCLKCEKGYFLKNGRCELTQHNLYFLFFLSLVPITFLIIFYFRRKRKPLKTKKIQDQIHEYPSIQF